MKTEIGEVLAWCCSPRDIRFQCYSCYSMRFVKCTTTMVIKDQGLSGDSMAFVLPSIFCGVMSCACPSMLSQIASLHVPVCDAGVRPMECGFTGFGVLPKIPASMRMDPACLENIALPLRAVMLFCTVRVLLFLATPGYQQFVCCCA